MIPAMNHPLGEYWSQPNREDVLIDETHALLSVANFEKLSEYSCSFPSGVYPGKMWKSRTNNGWRLVWFSLSEIEGSCNFNEREIIVELQL